MSRIKKYSVNISLLGDSLSVIPNAVEGDPGGTLQICGPDKKPIPQFGDGRCRLMVSAGNTLVGPQCPSCSGFVDCTPVFVEGDYEHNVLLTPLAGTTFIQHAGNLLCGIKLDCVRAGVEASSQMGLI